VLILFGYSVLQFSYRGLHYCEFRAWVFTRWCSSERNIVCVSSVHRFHFCIYRGRAGDLCVSFFAPLFFCFGLVHLLACNLADPALTPTNYAVWHFTYLQMIKWTTTLYYKYSNRHKGMAASARHDLISPASTTRYHCIRRDILVKVKDTGVTLATSRSIPQLVGLHHLQGLTRSTVCWRHFSSPFMASEPTSKNTYKAPFRISLKYVLCIY
jgi:hypothetical protein